MKIFCFWGTYLREDQSETSARKTGSLVRPSRRVPVCCNGCWSRDDATRRPIVNVVPIHLSGQRNHSFMNEILWLEPKMFTREIRHNLKILEIACIFARGRIIFMIFWTKVQKHAYCQCQWRFSPGGTFSGIFTMLKDLANFWINRKANFDMNENLRVWGIITREKRQEVLKDSTYPVRKSFSPGGPHIRQPPKIGKF